MDKIRNAFHIIIGFSLLFAICNHSEVSTWPSRLAQTFVLCLFVGFIMGVGWEFVMGYLFKSPVSKLDIMLTTIGAIAGGICSIYFFDVKWLQTWTLILSGIILVIEIIRILRIKYHK